jgi:hypothetical protein
MGPDGHGKETEWGDTRGGGLQSEETLNWERYVERGPGCGGGGVHTIGYFIPSSVVLFCKIKNCPLRCELQMHRRDGYI